MPDIDAILAKVLALESLRSQLVRHAGATMEDFVPIIVSMAAAAPTLAVTLLASKDALKEAQVELLEKSLEGEKLKEKSAALERELERWRHGVQVEGDFVCPDSLRANELERQLREVKEAAVNTASSRAGTARVFAGMKRLELEEELKQCSEQMVRMQNEINRISEKETEARDIAELSQAYIAANDVLSSLPPSSSERERMDADRRRSEAYTALEAAAKEYR